MTYEVGYFLTVIQSKNLVGFAYGSGCNLKEQEKNHGILSTHSSVCLIRYHLMDDSMVPYGQVINS